jgi:hypothetical protein
MSPSHRRKASAVHHQAIPNRADGVRAQVYIDDDDVFSQCYSKYTATFLRDCLLDDGCTIPDECELLSLDDLAMMDTSGSSGILQGKPTKVSINVDAGTDTQESRDERARQPKKVTRMQHSVRSSGLALALQEGTRNSHSMAESSQFMIGFVKGLSTRSAFSD